MLILLGIGAGAVAPAMAEPLPMAEIAPGLYVHAGEQADASERNQGDIANIGFAVGSRGVAVIDTGGSAEIGRRLREAVEARTDKPILYVVNTHMHPDHIFGNAAFPGVPVAAHAELAAAAAARFDGYRRQLAETLGQAAADAVVPVPVDLPVESTRELDLGDRTLVLTAHRTAHTNNDLTVFDPKTETLWTGDLLFVDRIPSIDGSALGWLSVLEELTARPLRRVVPGHGPVSTDWPAAAAAERRYLTAVVDGVRAVQKRMGSIKEAVETVAADERSRWLLFDDYHPRNVTATFAELEWE
jgi:quinoprotein relay system zinc metallohydrolase 2